MNIFVRRFIFILVCVCLCCGLFTGCGGENGIAENDGLQAVIEPIDNEWLDEISRKSKTADSAQMPEYTGGDTVYVGTASPVEHVNPFYAESDGEKTAAELLSVRLLEIDREGCAVLLGNTGEKRDYKGTEYFYDGIADVEISDNTYYIDLNEEIYFSDGVNLTADDVIFSMYVLADPAYDGPFEFAELPVEGMKEYRSGMKPKWQIILDSLNQGNEASETKMYTDKELERFRDAFNAVGIEFTKEIIKESVATFAGDYSGFVLNRSAGEVIDSTGLQIAFAEYFCGYASGLDDSDGMWHDSAGRSYDLLESFPTEQEFWDMIVENHGYDISDTGINYEKLGNDNFEVLLKKELEGNYPELTVASGASETPDVITGIEKTGMYSLKVTLTEQPFEYTEKLSIPVCPLHHYGSRENYKYTENRFGFTKGDLTEVKTNALPLGAGAYAFKEFDGNSAVFQRNALYFRGCPNITYVCISEDSQDIRAIAGNDGGVSVESGRFESIGISPVRVNVGGEPMSDSSVSLRNAFCTLFEVYRAQAAEEYGVTEIELPGAPVPWKPTAAEYKEDMAETALSAAVGLLKSAGYTWNEQSERFTEAPEGASMTYELRAFKEDAAAFAARQASAVLKGIGITLKVTEHTSAESLKNFVSSGAADMWVMPLKGSICENINGLFHSSGGDNVFNISSPELDEKIEHGRSFRLRNVRNAYYRNLIEEIMEYGVIVPVYQEMDSLIISDNVVAESLAENMTPYWTWLREAWKLKMK